MQALVNKIAAICKPSVVILITLSTNVSVAQLPGRLTLEEANTLARNNYPVIKQLDLVKQTAGLNIENLKKGFLPQLSINGQATYQSDVTGLNLSLPGVKIDPMNKDQYRLSAEISQLLYDGNQNRSEREKQQLLSVVEQQKVEVELYKLRERINQLFMNILFMEAQMKQANLVKKEIDDGINKVEAQVQNGIVLRSNLNQLKAEQMKAVQRIRELSATRNGLLEVLGVFLGKELNNEVVFETPQITQTTLPAYISRPEIKLFADQVKLNTQLLKSIQAKNRPRASLFLQSGYGRPALNMLNNQFDFYYLGGLRINWSLGNLYTSKNEKQLVDINRRLIGIQQEIFLLNSNAQLKQQEAEINRFRELISVDEEIIKLRQQVTAAAKAQLENAVITTSDFIQQVNAEDNARQQMITHQVQLVQAQVNYMTITGKL